MSKNAYRWLPLLASLIFVLAGCAPRTGGGETAAAAADGGLVVDLPAIVVDFDESGQASIGGVPAADLGAAFGAPLDGLQLSADQIQMLIDSNIQHVQINNSNTGLNILVNGQPIPSISWTADSLANANQLLAMWDDSELGPVTELLPLISNLGAGAVLRFPLAQGAEVIPAEISGEDSSAATAAAAESEFLDQAGSPARINLPINYNEDGTFNIGDQSAEALSLALGLPLESLTLSEERLSMYQEMGMETFTIATDTDGIHMTLNGEDLPFISWGDGRLAYGLQIAAQAGLLGDGGNTDAMMDLVQQLLPIIQTAQVTVHITFP
ncbi:MAG: hypothetical protein KDE19_20190 [Caldilineaceae bacterium]|nr:hypothetical protein [Caldilineaceae bacterium]